MSRIGAERQLGEARQMFERAGFAAQSGQLATAINLYRQVYAKCNIALQSNLLPPNLALLATQFASTSESRIRALQSAPPPPASSRPIRSSSQLLRPAPPPPPSDDVNMSSAILSERPNVKFSDVAGLSSAKHLLNEAVIMPLRLPELYVGPTRPWAGILLFGPPGTGKSFLAKAVAGEATNTTFLTVSNADLTSKWVGESEKLVRSLFETARRNRPSVVFIDEIDALVSARGGNESESGKRIKTEFLVQMDGVGAQNDGVLIIAATNLPWDLDQAMLRRFERRIYIPLPDVTAREVLIKNKLREAFHSLTDADVNGIAKATDGYSGADLSTLVRDALMQPIRQVEQAEEFIQVKGRDLAGNERDGLWAPKVGWTGFWKTSRRCKWDEIPKEQLARPIATADHFKQSVRKMRPSIDRSFLARYEKWTRELGEMGV